MISQPFEAHHALVGRSSRESQNFLIPVEESGNSQELTGVQLTLPGLFEQPLLTGDFHDEGCYRFGIYELNEG